MSGKFGHTFANIGNPDKTALNEPSHQDFHCLLKFICYSEFSLPSDFTIPQSDTGKIPT